MFLVARTRQKQQLLRTKINLAHTLPGKLALKQMSCSFCVTWGCLCLDNWIGLATVILLHGRETITVAATVATPLLVPTACQMQHKVFTYIIQHNSHTLGIISIPPPHPRIYEETEAEIKALGMIRTWAGSNKP